MEAVKLLEKPDAAIDWQYDGEADTIYLSFGKPKPAVGIDAGRGVIIRFNEKSREVVGLTIVGVGKNLETYLRKEK